MQVRTSWIYRYAALASLVPWVLSFGFPTYSYTIEYSQQEGFITGIYALSLGWLGVLGGVSFAWLANPIWAYLMIRMLQGRPPHLLLAMAALAFAFMARVPFDLSSLDDGADGSAYPMRGVDVWITSIAVIVVTSIGSAVANVKMNNSKP